MGPVVVVLSRIIAAWLAGFFGWLAIKFGIDVGAEAQQSLVQGIVGIIIPLFVTLYAVFHKTISRWTNPGDAASSHLAKKESAETAVLKHNSPS